MKQSIVLCMFICLLAFWSAEAGGGYGYDDYTKCKNDYGGSYDKCPTGDPYDTNPCDGYKYANNDKKVDDWGHDDDGDWYVSMQTAVKNKKLKKKLPKGVVDFYNIRYRSYSNAPSCNTKVYESPTNNAYPRYYWQTDCPYYIYYITWVVIDDYFKCYVLAPCVQMARGVECKEEYCQNRCSKSDPKKKNSKCFETGYTTTTVWAYCPYSSYGAYDYAQDNCKKRPWDCVRQIEIVLPQCCECMTCQDMRITQLYVGK